jgi:hypothetical protein
LFKVGTNPSEMAHAEDCRHDRPVPPAKLSHALGGGNDGFIHKRNGNYSGRKTVLLERERDAYVWI